MSAHKDKKTRLWVPHGSLRTATSVSSRRTAVDTLLVNGLPYSKLSDLGPSNIHSFTHIFIRRKLAGHTSCVNALTISSDGRWLASAGDDPYVHLWDFNQETLSEPAWKFVGPKSNVFTLAFSASGQYLFSGDTRADILQYDLSHTTSPIASRSGRPSPLYASDNQHDDSIREISCHPEQDHVFLSASEDGRIILHDMRADARRTRAQGILQQIAPFSAVQYHPTMTQLFATSDTQGVVCLRDVRMAFGPASQRQRKGVVHKYVTTIAKQGQACMAKPETSSLTFDREGRKLALTMLHHTPTLYTLEDPYPIATFSGRHHPDGSLVLPGERTWSNSCTMKYGTFGGFGLDRDNYYAHGSDDFRTYLWKIPDEAALREQRVVIDHANWDSGAGAGQIGYAQSYFSPRYVPVELSVPHSHLTGHESIVNTALIHPDRPYLLTAGIERYIRLHSPTAASPSTEPLTPTPQEVRAVSASDSNSRTLLLRAMGIIDDPVDEGDDDDGQAIALFDQILRTEGNGDVFEIRAFGPGYEDTSDEDSDEEMEDSD